MINDIFSTMLLLMSNLIAKLILLFRYPRFPSKRLGPYKKIGAIQTRIPGGTGCQIHYPAKDNTGSKIQPYFHPSAVKGIATYSRMNPLLLSFLSGRKHPCLFNADPINDSQEKKKKFPIVIFSHGLGGCMEMYTQLCQEIASYGFWVIALEHMDGSGSYAETPTGDIIPYKRPDDTTPYSRQKILNFSRPFLHQRVKETAHVIDYILGKAYDHDTNTKPENNELEEKVFQAADRSQGVALVGHSFGGAYMVMTAQKYFSSSGTESEGTTNHLSSICVLDPWAFPLDDKVLEQGIKSIPLLSILSESRLTIPETDQIKTLLQNSERVSSFYVQDSLHTSFSDTVSWLPGFMVKRMEMLGMKEKKHECIQSVAEALYISFGKSIGIDNSASAGKLYYDKIRPFPFSDMEKNDKVHGVHGKGGRKNKEKSFWDHSG